MNSFLHDEVTDILPSERERHRQTPPIRRLGTDADPYFKGLRTIQEIFDVDPQAGYNWLGAAATANDLPALFRPGAIK